MEKRMYWIIFTMLVSGILLFGCTGNAKNEETGDSAQIKAPEANERQDAQQNLLKEGWQEKAGRCSGLNEVSGEKSSCLAKVAADEKKPEICDMVFGFGYRLWCYSKLYDSSIDSSVCDNADDLVKGKCIAYIATKTGDVGICNKNKVGSFETAACKALVSGNQEYCAQASGQLEKDYCYDSLARKLEDLALCDKLTSYKYSCVSAIAASKKDISICDGLRFGKGELGMDEKAFCISRVAEETKNEGICNMIQNDENKDTCYMKVADAKNDKTVCAQIKNEGVRGFCQRTA
ncbi:hypothetical protein FJZ26_01690 [Candidatus Parvarchaeota archaeon]|nr:hypothetical protein [Candidatus Parvarchaeota archaeon]